MELYQIRYFLAVADTLNFTRASERSFVSQPALTKAIQRLEETGGGRLFDRTRNSVQLSELGQVMLPNFRQIYESANQAREQARRFGRNHKDVVRIGVMCTIDFQQVLPGFVRSQEGRNDVTLSFQEGNLEALTDSLDQGAWTSASCARPTTSRSASGPCRCSAKTTWWPSATTTASAIAPRSRSPS